MSASWDRRKFIRYASGSVGLSLLPASLTYAFPIHSVIPAPVAKEPLRITVNGTVYQVEVDARQSLLDFLREELGFTGTKKGCDMGHCGACILHVNGKRVNACLTLAIDQQDSQVVTIEGLVKGEQLHPLQEAFIKYDGFQCGYCTSGQIMSGVACLREGKAGSREEIQAYMEGNICRCGCYQNIVDAIEEVKRSGVAL